MKIVVLAGGLSTERDVSFKTGEMVTKALRENGHQVILLDVFMGYSDKEEDLTGIFDRAEAVSVKVAAIPETAPDLEKVKAQRKDQSDNFFGPNVIELCRMADIVFMALHGENGENGKIQAAFDLFGIRYTGTGYLGSALAMNKGMAKQLFLENGIPTPRGTSLKRGEDAAKIEACGIHFPCVVKPCSGGSSIGVSIVHDKAEYERALKEAFRWENELVIEEYVKGREFSVGVIDFQALPIIEIAPVEGFYDYKNKYKAGSTVETCPAELSEQITKEMQGYAEKVAEVLGLNTYSRTDFLLDAEDHIFCLEANTLPGMTPTSLLPQEAKVTGVDFNQLCEKLIESSMRKYKN
ncbi:MAG: D-alanine--D-alanine ligase [Roseburia hominis]|uniref:D-alanine--D-alanine ligase family protein n=1 Tax=Roseburia hominis TaxID=301301 RepID=UPI0026EF6459|nr:D-alanine--D-alanine ligase [Roseburia hominis]MCI7524325.1 D-alanine--D-alanine ligase [Roseburia hominis]MDD6243360.1 D-alanine--D-alanine ligase [Roseburia hominis]